MADDIRVKFDADASSYNRQLKDLQQQNKTLKSELDKVKSSTDENTTSQEKAAKITEALQKQVKGQEEYVKALKAEYDKLSQSEGANTTELMKQEEKINKAETALNKMNEELTEAQRESTGAAEGVDAAATSMEKMRAAEVVAEIVGKASEQFQKLASSAYDAAKELDKGYDTIVKKTGASGAALEEMTDIADDLYSTMPASMEDIGKAVGEVNTRLGLSGKELRSTSEAFLKFSRINDTDVSTSVDTVQKALSAFGLQASDTERILDTMTAAGQDSGVGMNELASAMVKNAGALSELGLSAEESILFIGRLEKSGVDSETALSGMSRALKNAVKQGKPLNEALSELEDTILNGTDGMDGLSASYDLFGKSGDKIYNALKTGSISFKNLTGNVRDYSGTVKNTYEGTLSAWDKSTVAMNNLKLAGSELTKEVLSTLAPALEKVVDGVQKAVKWFKNLPEPAKKVVSMIIAAGAAAGVAVPKFQGILTTIGQFNVAKAINGLSGMKSIMGETSISAEKLSGAMALFSNPLTLAVAGISAAGLALVGLAAHTQAQIEAEYGLTEEQKKNIEAVHESFEAYQELTAQRQEQAGAVQAEWDYLDDLVDEYNSLIDANGNVIHGYEDRADFILGELSKATGKSVEDIEKETEVTGKLGESIRDVIDLKRAEATLTAYESAYAEAKQKHTAAYQRYVTAVADAKTAEENYNRVMAGRAGEYIKQKDALAQQLVGLDQTSQRYLDLKLAMDALDESYTQERIELTTVTQAWDRARQAVSEAGQEYAGYNATLKNYEGLSVAIASGDAAAVDAAMQNLVNSFQTAETGTKESLEAQVETLEKSLSDMEKALESGAVDQAAVDMARQLVEDAKAELKKFEQIGESIPEGLDKGIEKKRRVLARKAKQLGIDTVKDVAVGAETNSPSRATMRTGNDVVQGLVSGIKAKEGLVAATGKGIGKTATDSIKPSIEGVYAAGANLAGQVESGIKSKQNSVRATAQGVGTTANRSVKPSTSGVYGAGQALDDSLIGGMESKRGAVGSKATEVQTAAYKAKPAYSGMYSAGDYAMQGLIDGLEHKRAVLARKAEQIGLLVASSTQSSLRERSPSKVMEQIGEYAAEGLAIGLDKPSLIQKALDSVAAPMLTFGADGINGKSTSTNYTYGDAHITIYPQDGQSAKEIAREVEQIIYRRANSYGRAFA